MKLHLTLLLAQAATEAFAVWPFEQAPYPSVLQPRMPQQNAGWSQDDASLMQLQTQQQVPQQQFTQQQFPQPFTQQQFPQQFTQQQVPQQHFTQQQFPRMSQQNAGWSQDDASLLQLQTQQQVPQQHSPQQQFTQQQLGMPDAGMGMALNQMGQSASQQDILGLVGSLGDETRKAKSLQTQLKQEQANEQQLLNMVRSEKKRSVAVDQNARRLAQQAEQSLTSQKAELDDLRNNFAVMKQQSNAEHTHLMDEESKNQKLSSQLYQTRQTLQGYQAKVATAQRRAQEAEAREANALKAGELEDMALTQQEALLNKVRGGFGERLVEHPELRAAPVNPRQYDLPAAHTGSSGRFLGRQ